MRKDRLYLFTFLALALVFIGVSSVAIKYFVNEAAEKVLNTQLEFSKREAKQVAMLIGNQLEEGVSKENVAGTTQQSLEDSNNGSGFISVFNWSGEIVCHPDVKQLGQQISNDVSVISSVSDEMTSNDLYQLLQDNEESPRLKNSDDSEVVFLYPVPNSDWIVASHANTAKVSQQIKAIRSNFQTILLVMGFLFILSSVLIVRLIGSNYEKKLELKNEKLSDEIINLSKLNSAVDTYQKKVSDAPKLDENTDKGSKKRILTYVRNELSPVATEDISYIYTDTGITYVICADGKKTTSNFSLDELYANLDNAYFFRANRQFIIAISAIDKIVKYGNNQLKILINPNSEVDIIISKNKASEFKKWLNL